LRQTRIIFLVLLLAASLFAAGVPLSAQTANTIQDAVRTDPHAFPQWAKDVRRFDIVTFGAFPFAFFTASFLTDGIRWAQFDGDMRYAPWPLKGAGAYDPTTEEKLQTIGIAVGLSLLVAAADFVVVQIKRYNEKKNARTPDNQPVVTKRPLYANPSGPRGGTDAEE
jgi:hypothetical protein